MFKIQIQLVMIFTKYHNTLLSLAKFEIFFFLSESSLFYKLNANINDKNAGGNRKYNENGMRLYYFRGKENFSPNSQIS